MRCDVGQMRQRLLLTWVRACLTPLSSQTMWQSKRALLYCSRLY